MGTTKKFTFQDDDTSYYPGLMRGRYLFNTQQAVTRYYLVTSRVPTLVGCVCFKFRADFGRLQPCASQTHSREVQTIQCTGTSDPTVKHLQPGRARDTARQGAGSCIRQACKDGSMRMSWHRDRTLSLGTLAPTIQFSVATTDLCASFRVVVDSSTQVATIPESFITPGIYAGTL